MANTLAYYNTATITVVKKFYSTGPPWSVINNRFDEGLTFLNWFIFWHLLIFIRNFFHIFKLRFLKIFLKKNLSLFLRFFAFLSQEPELLTWILGKLSCLFYKLFTMEFYNLKNVNNCLNTNIYSYLETSGVQSSNVYLNVVHFLTQVLIRYVLT